MVLGAKEKVNEHIVKIKGAHMVNFNAEELRAKMKHNAKEGCINFPVDMMTMNIGWIVNSDHGYDFLNAVWRSYDLDLYNVPSLQMTIDFLYTEIKKRILYVLMPLFLAQLAVFLSFIILDEELVKIQK